MCSELGPPVDHDGGRLKILRPDGMYDTVAADSYPGDQVYIVRQVGDEVWVGTDVGIGVYDLTGAPKQQLTDVLDKVGADTPAGPISEIYAFEDGEVWVGTRQKGLKRRNLRAFGAL